jgi:hypothetical protein
MSLPARDDLGCILNGHMKHSSDILLHFVDRAHRADPTAQAETCLKILRQGFRFSTQATNFGVSIGGIPIGLSVPAVCFTDVPLRMAQSHADRYGKCAIGVRKSLVKKWSGNPVLYLVDRQEAELVGAPHTRTNLRGTFGTHIADLTRMILMDPETSAKMLPEGHWFRTLNEAQRNQCRSDVGWIISHVKETFDLGADVDGEEEPGARRDRYYMEREWRVCLSGLLRSTAEMEGGSRVAVKDGDHFYLPMGRGDVRVMIVPNDRVRGDVAQTLLNEGWAPKELPSMITFDESADL